MKRTRKTEVEPLSAAAGEHIHSHGDVTSCAMAVLFSLFRLFSLCLECSCFPTIISFLPKWMSCSVTQQCPTGGGEQRPLLVEATVSILLLLNSMEAPEDKLVFYNS